MYTLYAGGVAMLLYINELIIEQLVSNRYGKYVSQMTTDMFRFSYSHFGPFLRHGI
jgi:hypothetical protein